MKYLSKPKQINEKNNRPILVWIVVVWFTLGALLAIYDLYFSANAEKLTLLGMDESSFLIYYIIRTYIPKLFALVAAVLLFVREPLAKWLFFALFGISSVIRIYTIIVEPLPENFEFGYLLSILFAPLLYAYVAWYSFYLGRKNYYVRNSSV